MVRPKDDRHGRSPDRGEQLRATSSAKLASQQGTDDHGRRQSERWPDAKSGERDPKERQRHAGEQRGEDRLVDIPALKVAGRVEEVQLVAVVAVETRQRHHHAERHTGDNEDSAIVGTEWLGPKRFAGFDFASRRHSRKATRECAQMGRPRWRLVELVLRIPKIVATPPNNPQLLRPRSPAR